MAYHPRLAPPPFPPYVRSGSPSTDTSPEDSISSDDLPQNSGPTGRVSEPRRAAGLHDRLDEIELILSGAVVYALIQIPGRVDQAYLAFAPRVSGAFELAGFLGFYYAKLILYTLILTFVAHLSVRAFWVAMEGLHSVYPDGVRWANLRLGPIAGRVFPETIPSARALANRADSLASVLFSAAFSLVLMFAFWTVLGVSLLVLAVLAVRLFPDVEPRAVLLWSTVGLVLLFVLPRLVDVTLGRRIREGSVGARLLERALRIQARGFSAALGPPIYMTLASHLGRVRTGIAVGVAVIALAAFFIVHDVLVPEDRLVMSPSRAVPLEAGDMGVDPRYYEAYRTDWQIEYPSVESERVSEDLPWVRLFVPFRPRNDQAAVDRMCPEVSVGGREGIQIREDPRAPPDSRDSDIADALVCIGALWDVSLDGLPIEASPGNPDASPVFLRHPDTGIRGIARYIDVRALALGRHVLTVTRSDRARPPDAATPPIRHEIIFWR